MPIAETAIISHEAVVATDAVIGPYAVIGPHVTIGPGTIVGPHVRIEGPTMTRMLDTLEADGLVERLADPTDRRTKLLRVTAQGERALADIFAIADELRERLVDGIAPERIEDLNGFFGLLMDRLDAGLPARG